MPHISVTFVYLVFPSVMKESLINICLILEPCDCNHLFKWLTSRHITCTQPSLIIPVHSKFFIWIPWMAPITLSSHLGFIYTVSCLHMNLQVADFQRCHCATTQTSLDPVFRRADRIESSKEPEPVPSTSNMSDIALVLCLRLLMIFQLYHLPLSLPPPISNSSCLFTQGQPLYASCCTILWYFSR